MQIRVIGIGDTGNDVAALQGGLLHFFEKHDMEDEYDLLERCGGCDGIFGEGTENAVREYQRKNNLAIDGVVGEETWNDLLSD